MVDGMASSLVSRQQQWRGKEGMLYNSSSIQIIRRPRAPLPLLGVSSLAEYR